MLTVVANFAFKRSRKLVDMRPPEMQYTPHNRDPCRKSRNTQPRAQSPGSLWLGVRKCSSSDSTTARQMRALYRNIFKVTLHESLHVVAWRSGARSTTLQWPLSRTRDSGVLATRVNSRHRVGITEPPREAVCNLRGGGLGTEELGFCWESWCLKWVMFSRMTQHPAPLKLPFGSGLALREEAQRA